MPFDTVLFDAGNTLCLFNMNVVGEVLSDLGIEASPADLWAAELRSRAKLDRPELVARTTDDDRWYALVKAVVEEIAPSLNPLLPTVIRRLRAYHDRNNLWDFLPPDAIPLLVRLRSRSLRLGVVSNSDGSVGRLLERLGLAAYFDQIVDSSREGIEKPDPRLFRIALGRLGAAPGTTVYVGDLYHVDAVGARSAGITPILLDPTDRHADKPVLRIRTLSELERLLADGSGAPKPRPA